MASCRNHCDCVSSRTYNRPRRAILCCFAVVACGFDEDWGTKNGDMPLKMHRQPSQNRGDGRLDNVPPYSGGLATVAAPTRLYRMTPVSSQKKNLTPVTPKTTGAPFMV